MKQSGMMMAGEGPKDILGDLLALRLLVQRLYGRVALATGGGNTLLERERQAILNDLTNQTVECPGIDPEAVRKRAEAMVDIIFDGMRVTVPPDPNKPGT
jgi:hypothetical protein